MSEIDFCDFRPKQGFQVITLASDFGFRDIRMPNDPSVVVLSKNIQKSSIFEGMAGV